MSEAAHILPAGLRFAVACEYAGMTKHQLRPLLESGEIEARKIGRVWIVKRESIDSYLSEPADRAKLIVRSVLAS